MLLPELPLDRVLGGRTAKQFAKNLGLETVADLLQHYPRRYTTRGELTPISDLPVGESVSIVAEVVDARERRVRGKVKHILEVRITDGNGILTLTFFNQAWRQKTLQPGLRGLFSGKISQYQGKFQLSHPEYELFDQEVSEVHAKAWAEEPIPIYPASSNTTTWTIQKAMAVVLDTLEVIPDEIPETLRKKHGLLDIKTALEKIHRPASNSDWQSATETLRYHEAFVLQSQLVDRRKENENTKAVSRNGKDSNFLNSFDNSLDFQLTKGQVAVGEEITQDLSKNYPMNRLLQGEVGSGKTLVALRAMLTVADSNAQSALLAPTEVLASQHFNSISKSLGAELTKELGLILLTGQMPTSERKKALLSLVCGKSKIVVGTHALFAEKVEFYDLGLVVIDEQHRFGVEQRERLRLKGKTSPHVLTMTATPIPRTLAVTVFGDMEISTLTELPGGRKPIDSHVVLANNKQLVARVWERVREEVAKGHQVFVVCPKIEESDKDQLGASVEATLRALKTNQTLAGLRIESLHGKLDSELKARTMADFASGAIDVLVATTVIEVGVDVPNATVMVILDADNFGISQLHQLRGRVGRGSAKGLCLLLTAADEGSIALERIRAVADNLDGFKLSEIDLELRREGDVLGQRQSGGQSSLRLLRVLKDSELIQQVRLEVQEMFEKDPALTSNNTLRLVLDELTKLKIFQKCESY